MGMFAKSITFDVETLSAGTPVSIYFPAVNQRKYEKMFYGIIIESTPLQIRITYYDPREAAMSKKGGNIKGLVTRYFTLEEAISRKIEINPLIIKQ